MAVSAIFVILSGVVLSNNTRFGSVIILQNLAHDIALSIRQAQVYGIAVRRCDPGAAAICNIVENEFNLAYGMHFGRNVQSFELFADVDNNAHYDGGETVLSTAIGSGYRIDDLCRTPANGGNEVCGLEELNIAFRRPEPDACIDGAFVADEGDLNNLECESEYGRARIIVKSTRDDTSEIHVESTGQISVK